MNGVRVRRAPVQQPQRQAEIGLDHLIAVGRRGLRDRAEMDDGVELAALRASRSRSDGGTKSASWRLARLRHLPSPPSMSYTAHPPGRRR